MAQRIAVMMALLVFAVCLVVGGIQADNPFATAVTRALWAMGGTYLVGLALGAMGQRMVEENVRGEEEKLKNSSMPQELNDR